MTTREGRGRPAIFLDRDGTINPDTGYTWRIEDCALLPEVGPALRVMQDLGYELVVVTNQAGIAKGYYGEAEMHAYNRALAALLVPFGVDLRNFYFCPYHKDAERAQYRQDSQMRKPNPGMFLQAAQELGLDTSRSYGIGDRESDIRATQAVGAQAILVLTGETLAPPKWPDPQPVCIARHLGEAAAFIARAGRVTP